MIDRIKLERRTDIPRWARWSAYMMFAWALLFGSLHFAWGAGLTPLIEKSEGIQPDTLAWRLCVGALCIIAILAGMAFLQTRRRIFPPRLLQISSLTGSTLVFLYVMWSYHINVPSHWTLAVGVLCVAGALIALALTQPWGQYIIRWPMLLYAWVGGGLLTLHALYGYVIHGLAGAGIITWTQVQQWAGAPITPMSDEAIRELITEGMLIWNPWFLLGGILYLFVAWYGSQNVTVTTDRRPHNDVI